MRIPITALIDDAGSLLVWLGHNTTPATAGRGVSWAIEGVEPFATFKPEHDLNISMRSIAPRMGVTFTAWAHHEDLITGVPTRAEEMAATLTRDEASLLMYFETCVVDLNGRVDLEKMNATDMIIRDRFVDAGLINFGRIVYADHNRQGGNWVEMTPFAMNLAHALRKQRASRGEQNRRYRKTEERNA